MDVELPFSSSCRLPWSDPWLSAWAVESVDKHNKATVRQAVISIFLQSRRGLYPQTILIGFLLASPLPSSLSLCSSTPLSPPVLSRVGLTNNRKCLCFHSHLPLPTFVLTLHFFVSQLSERGIRLVVQPVLLVFSFFNHPVSQTCDVMSVVKTQQFFVGGKKGFWSSEWMGR